MPIEIFNKSSIQSLLVHVANVYVDWIANNAMQKDLPFFKVESFTNKSAVYNLFNQVNALVLDFLFRFENQLEEPLQIKIVRLDKNIDASPLKIFTHVITHEFHHKGQILIMSRQLGYTPIDTDVIRF